VHRMGSILTLLAALAGAGCSVFGGQAAPEPEYRVEVMVPVSGGG